MNYFVRTLTGLARTLETSKAGVQRSLTNVDLFSYLTPDASTASLCDAADKMYDTHSLPGFLYAMHGNAVHYKNMTLKITRKKNSVPLKIEKTKDMSYSDFVYSGVIRD